MTWLIPWVVSTLKADTACSAVLGERVLTDANVGARGLQWSELDANMIDGDSELLPFAFIAPEVGTPNGAYSYLDRFCVYLYISAAVDDFTETLNRARVATRAALHLRSTPRLYDSVANSIAVIRARGGNRALGVEASLNNAARAWERFVAEYWI